MTTKLYIPPPRPNLVERTFLIKRLDEGLHRGHKLTLLSAPAGFGKTTLLSEWVAECRWSVAWVSLDEEDNAPARFLTYLIAALQTVHKSVGKGLLEALQSPQSPSPASILAALINELASMECCLLLVLDDYHLIKTQAIHDILGFFIEHQPAQLHLVISTRIDPPLPLARLRARGQLLELRQADLRFTREEVSKFLHQVTGLALSPDDVDALTSRTEGWIAGLQLAALSMQRRDDPADFVRTFTGSHRYIIDYLVEEVLSQQQEDLQAFLLQTSILDRMTDSLCNAVTGCGGSQATLERLEQENLFVIPLDDDRRWYRYHNLFRDVLRQCLLRTRPQLVPILHDCASTWYEENQFMAGAVDHALQAGDMARATRLIDQHSEKLWIRGEQATLLKWLDALPSEQVREHARICTFYALALFTAGRRDEADTYLDMAQQALDTQAARDQPALSGILNTARAIVTISRGDLPEIVRLSRRALTHLPEDDHTWRSTAAFTLGLAQRLGGDLASAERTLAEAVKLSTVTGNSYVALIARHNLARLQAQRGRLRQAAGILRQAGRIANETGMSQLPAASLVSAELGSIFIEWNDLDEALRLLEKSLDLISRGQDLTALATSYAFMTRALFARGDVDGAQEAIRTMEHLAEGGRVSPWIAYWILGLRLQALLERGDPASAARLAEQAGLSLNEQPTYGREMAYTSFIRLHIEQGQPAATMGLLERLLQMAEGAGRWGRVISTLALRASARHAADDIDGALADLSRALSLAEPHGYVRVFLEQGPAMGNLLRLAATQGISPAYASRLVAEFDRSAPRECSSEQPLIEPLTDRELEVLRFLASDLTMEEIGQELFVARSTVRSHAKSIYGKLNVHSRREAVRRAQALGLLN